MHEETERGTDIVPLCFSDLRNPRLVSFSSLPVAFRYIRLAIDELSLPELKRQQLKDLQIQILAA